MIGSSLEAYAFAFKNQCKILDPFREHTYHEFDELIEGEFKFFNFINYQKTINTNLGPAKEWSVYKEDIRRFLKFCLGLNGDVLFPVVLKNPSNVHFYYDDSSDQILVTKGNKTHYIKFKYLHVFEDENIDGTFYKCNIDNNVQFVDYVDCRVNFNRGGVHLDSVYFLEEDNPIKEVHFAKSSHVNLIIKSDFELKDIDDSNYHLSDILLSLQGMFWGACGCIPYFTVNSHRRRIVYNKTDKKPKKGIFTYEDIDIVEQLSDLDENNQNVIRAMQLYLRNLNGEDILENHRREVYSKISLKRKEGISN